ncbi:MAG: peptigoglycan-binding protein LysM, partial [Rhizobiaceae bacterium]
MVATPLKVLAFVLGGTGVAAGAAGVAYVAGALDFLTGDQPSTIVSNDPAAPKGDAAGAGNAMAPAEPAKPEEQVALTPPADATTPATESGAGEPAAPAEAAVPAPGADKKAEEPAAPAASQTTIPSFDIVRVEGDGSIVIAGKSAPGAYVEVVTGGNAIAADTATPEGDWAAVPDERLKPGDYQVMLRAIAPGNVVAVSEETALISVPEKADGQV